MKKNILALTASVLLMLSGTASASLLVDTYAINFDFAPGSTYNVANVQAAIDAGAPHITTTTSVVDFVDNFGAPGDYGNNVAFAGGLQDLIGMHITGFVEVVTAGTYTFRSYVDDGAQLKIGGVTLFSDLNGHAPEYRSGEITLTAGLHSLDFLYFEFFGGATVELDARLGDGAYALLGASNGLATSIESATSVPEPGSVALIGLGLLGFVLARRKQKNNC